MIGGVLDLGELVKPAQNRHLIAHIVTHFVGNVCWKELILGKDCIFGTKVGKHCL